MTGFMGMDPAAVRGVAHRLQAQATTLAGVIASVQAAVDQALALWDGDDAHGFHGWWNTQHRPGLQAAQEMVSQVATRLEQQVQEQERASGLAGSGGGADPLGTLRTSTRSLFDAAGSVLGPAGLVTTGMTAFAAVAKAGVSGRYTDGWRAIIRGADNLHVPAAFTRFKQSPVLQAIHPALRAHGGLIASGGRIAGGVGKVGGVVSGAGSLFGMADGAARGNGGDVAYNGLSLTATGLKTAGKTPITYIAGAGLQAWTETGRIATTQVDWSADGIKAIVTASPADWGRAIWDSRNDYADAFTKVFG
ncbi:WXG100 family type VII secretion target [Nocardioides kongjuensis]|uniref:Uncharacterized protein YukE n=1 Tax=Nocardioides kongjuensis TaxID=349522 RepID=A0A852RSD0_9ACTN|nr:WXG100 family type VII secretion target [Nocardioides kongjuensis]NYD33795.1 uncharacterized protein YukE [Nocardioides kongjuensis]